jgi:hypothetical protein
MLKLFVHAAGFFFIFTLACWVAFCVMRWYKACGCTHYPDPDGYRACERLGVLGAMTFCLLVCLYVLALLCQYHLFCVFFSLILAL